MFTDEMEVNPVASLVTHGLFSLPLIELEFREERAVVIRFDLDDIIRARATRKVRSLKQEESIYLYMKTYLSCNTKYD